MCWVDVFIRSSALLAMFAGTVTLNAENSQGKVSRSDPHSQTDRQTDKQTNRILWSLSFISSSLGRSWGGGGQFLLSFSQQSTREGKMGGKVNILNKELWPSVSTNLKLVNQIQGKWIYDCDLFKVCNFSYDKPLWLFTLGARKPR